MNNCAFTFRGFQITHKAKQLTTCQRTNYHFTIYQLQLELFRSRNICTANEYFPKMLKIFNYIYLHFLMPFYCRFFAQEIATFVLLPKLVLWISWFAVKEYIIDAKCFFLKTKPEFISLYSKELNKVEFQVNHYYHYYYYYVFLGYVRCLITNNIHPFLFIFRLVSCCQWNKNTIFATGSKRVKSEKLASKLFVGCISTATNAYFGVWEIFFCSEFIL